MREYSELIAKLKRVKSFVLDKADSGVLVNASSYAPLISNLIINNKQGKGSLRIIVASLDFEGNISNKMEIVEVSAGDTFSFSDYTGLSFWNGACIFYEKSGSGKTLITIGYHKFENCEYGIYTRESKVLNLTENKRPTRSSKGVFIKCV